MSLKKQAEKIRAQGRGKDDQLVHLTTREVNSLKGLAALAGGELTTNPKTGLPEAGFLDSLLPTILGFGAMFIPGMQPLGAAAIGAGAGALTNKDDPLMGALMGGLGAYGGAGLGSGLQGVGVNAAQQAAIQGSQSLAESAIGQGLQSGATQGLQQGVMQGLNPNTLAPELLGQTAAQNTLAAEASKNFLSQPTMTQLGQGAQAAFQPGGLSAFVDSMGGLGKTAQKTAMAAAPLLYREVMPKTESDGGGSRPSGNIPKYRYDGEVNEDYYVQPADPSQGLGYTGERDFFPGNRFTRMASGGLAAYAGGGHVPLRSGDFVVPADVVAYAGGGSTNAGQKILARKLGAEPIRGPGTGLSDDIPASIDGKQPARVADGEMVVRNPGKKGARRLYAMLDNIRKQATGSTKQVRPVNIDKALA